MRPSGKTMTDLYSKTKNTIHVVVALLLCGKAVAKLWQKLQQRYEQHGRKNCDIPTVSRLFVPCFCGTALDGF